MGQESRPPKSELCVGVLNEFLLPIHLSLVKLHWSLGLAHCFFCHHSPPSPIPKALSCPGPRGQSCEQNSSSFPPCGAPNPSVPTLTGMAQVTDYASLCMPASKEACSPFHEAIPLLRTTSCLSTGHVVLQCHRTLPRQVTQLSKGF